MRPCWLIYLKVLRKVLLSHAEVLVLQLLNATFKSSIFVPKLNKLCINLIDSCNFWGNIFESSSLPKLSVFCVTLLHDILDLG